MSTLVPQLESYAACSAEAAVLTAMHWQELYGNEDYRADSGAIIDMEKLGLFLFYTLRDEMDELAGYAGFTLKKSPFFGIAIAEDAGFYIHPAYRGTSGITKLLKFAVLNLKSRGVNRILVAHGASTDLSPLLQRAGFYKSSIVYSYEGE